MTRLHEEFVWLYDRFAENDSYAGFIIPPCPPKPDFGNSQGKLAKLQAADPTMTQADLEKLKQDIQSDYLATFQKTVAMHEVFLIRLASHAVMRNDDNLRVFLEFNKDVCLLHISHAFSALIIPVERTLAIKERHCHGFPQVCWQDHGQLIHQLQGHRPFL